MADNKDSTFETGHRVDKNVLISGYLLANNPKFIKQYKIRRIVKMFADDKSYVGGFHRHPGVKYLVVAADDSPDFDIRKGVIAGVLFIREGLKNDEQILVHCHAGISRSSTVVLMHLMLHRGFSLRDALRDLQKIRPQVQPNEGFMKMLFATDAKLRALRGKKEKEPGTVVVWNGGGSHAGDRDIEEDDTRPEWSFSG
jgi:hypothetical protein